MSVSNWIKQNFVLAVGLALPVLLIAGFLAATALPRMFATPPQYPLVFSFETYNERDLPYNIEYVVKGKTVKAVLTPSKKENNYSYRRERLMIYDAGADRVREITPDLPDAVTARREIVIPELKDMEIDDTLQSPDGYVLDTSYRGRGGIVPELFIGGSYRNEWRVRKGAAVYSIPLPNDMGRRHYNYYNARFVGWVVNE